MHYRTLGSSTLAVSATGLGCMSMSGVYGKGDDVESIAVIHHALDLGVNFLDTSDMYGWGHNEELVAHAPLGRSLLTGRVTRVADIPQDDRRRDHPRFKDENLLRNVELVRRIERIAQEKRCTPAQLALAWLLAQGPDVVPIPGTKRKERLEENLGALKVELSAEDVKRIAEAVPAGVAAGARYPEAALKAVYL